MDYLIENFNKRGISNINTINFLLKTMPLCDVEPYEWFDRYCRQHPNNITILQIAYHQSKDNYNRILNCKHVGCYNCLQVTIHYMYDYTSGKSLDKLKWSE